MKFILGQINPPFMKRILEVLEDNIKGLYQFLMPLKYMKVHPILI